MGGGALDAGGGMVCIPELVGGAGGVVLGSGGGGGVGGMFDCGEPAGGGGIGAVGGGGAGVPGSDGGGGGVGGVGTSCAIRTPEASKEPATRADSHGLRNFIVDTPCQNAGRGLRTIDGPATLSGTLANDL